MSDPLGFVNNAGVSGGASRAGMGPMGGVRPASGVKGPDPDGSGPNFRETLIENLDRVNELQQDASKATEDLLAGRRSDVEGVILATQKADMAFQMLQSLRNKVMQAYDEIKQTRV